MTAKEIDERLRLFNISAVCREIGINQGTLRTVRKGGPVLKATFDKVADWVEKNTRASDE